MKKCVSIFCVTVMLITALAGCNSPENETPNTPPVEGNTVNQEPQGGESSTDESPEPLWTPEPIEIKYLQPDPTQTGDLTVYITPSFLYGGSLIDFYKKIYPNVNVTKEDYLDADLDAFSAQLSVDIAAGKGPDVIFTDSMFNTDVYKVIQAGAFLELDDLIAQDASFDLNDDDYIKEVFDAAVYNGKRYAIPFSYSIPLYIANPYRLDDIGFDLSKASDTVSFLNEVVRTTPKAQATPNYLSSFEGSILGSELLNLSGIRLVDYETNTALPDEDGLKRLLDAFKPYYHIDADADSIDSNSFRGNYMSAAPFLNNGIVMFLLTPRPTAFIFTANEMNVRSDFEMIVIPDMDGKIHANCNRAAAIRAGSPNIQNAWNFIKIMLSYEMQSHMGITRGVPVMKSAIAAQVEEYRNIWDGVTGEFKNYTFKDMSDEEAQALIDAVMDIDSCGMFGTYTSPVTKMLVDHMTPYLKDEVSYETALTGLKNQLRLYVSE